MKIYFKNYSSSIRKTASIVTIFILVVSSVAFLVDYLPPSVSQPTIVMFGDSVEEKSALVELENNFPEATFVHYQAFIAQPGLLESQNPVIWVGHGLDEGMILSNQLYPDIISWKTISEIISQSNAQEHFFVACNSYNVRDYIQESDKKIVSFEKGIDAIFGANLISILIASKYDKFSISKFVTNLVDRFNEITSGDEILSLGSLSTDEKLDLFLMGFVTFMAIFFVLTLAAALYIQAAELWFFAIAGGLTAVWIGALSAAIADPTNGAKWVNFGLATISMLGSFTALAAALAADQATFPLKWPTMIVAAAAAVVSVAYFLIWEAHDRSDCNDIPARLEPGAYNGGLDPNADCPPPSSGGGGGGGYFI